MDEFLKGELVLKVSDEKQHNFLYQLACENNLLGDDKNFDYDPEYPYYFIQNDYQIQANRREQDAIYWLAEEGKTVSCKNFEDIFKI